MSAFWQPGYLPQSTIAGRSFHGSAGATGVTVPIYNSTSPTFALWNPVGSNRILIPVTFAIGVEATGTPAITTLGLSEVINTGAAVGTGNPVAAWTDATVYNGRVGRTGGNYGRIGVATTTLTSAGNFFYEFGFSQATTSLANGWVSLVHKFDGTIALEPGSLIHLVGAPLAPVEVLTPSITWIEIDYVS
jgi:hypothetical protein